MSSLQSHLYDEDDDDDDGGGQESLGSRDDHVTDSPGGGFFDHPPESFLVSTEDSEQDWFCRNAATVQRKASKKLTFSGGGCPGHCRMSSLASSSNRKRNLSLIALPAAQKSRPAAADGIFRRDNGGLFRSWSDPGGKVAVQAPEPGSPIVTCTGRVRTRKEGGRKTGLVKWFGTVLRNGFGKNRVSSKAGSG